MNRDGALRRAKCTLDADRPSPVESAVLLEAVDELSTPEEVHEAMKVFHSIYGQGGESRQGRLPGEGLSEKQADSIPFCSGSDMI
jgi:hypothetical protein